jgi:hypothetical protein
VEGDVGGRVRSYLQGVRWAVKGKERLGGIESNCFTAEIAKTAERALYTIPLCCHRLELRDMEGFLCVLGALCGQLQGVSSCDVTGASDAGGVRVTRAERCWDDGAIAGAHTSGCCSRRPGAEAWSGGAVGWGESDCGATADPLGQIPSESA